MKRSLTTALAFAALVALPATAEAGTGGIDPDGPPSGGSGGDVEGLSPSYEKFVNLVSGDTDLSLRVLGAWTLAEGGPRDNPLNIGPGKRFGSVSGGARATSQLLRESNYRKILASASRPDRDQISAIARSSWCPGCSGYERLLKRTYRQVTVKP